MLTPITWTFGCCGLVSRVCFGTPGKIARTLQRSKKVRTAAFGGSTKPAPGGWNRILLEVSDINAEAERLRTVGVKFQRDDIVTGPGGSQFWIVDPVWQPC